MVPDMTDDDFWKAHQNNQPFVTWCIMREEDVEYVLVEYDNRMCGFPYSQERMFPLCQ